MCSLFLHCLQVRTFKKIFLEGKWYLGSSIWMRCRKPSLPTVWISIISFAKQKETASVMPLRKLCDSQSVCNTMLNQFCFSCEVATAELSSQSTLCKAQCAFSSGGWINFRYFHLWSSQACSKSYIWLCLIQIFSLEPEIFPHYRTGAVSSSRKFALPAPSIMLLVVYFAAHVRTT